MKDISWYIHENGVKLSLIYYEEITLHFASKILLLVIGRGLLYLDGKWTGGREEETLKLVRKLF